MTTPQSAIDNWGTEKPVQLDVQVVPTSESEVEIGGEGHKVRIKSCAPIEDLVGLAKGLWEDCQPPRAEKPPVGFASPQIEMRAQPSYPAGTMTVPPGDL